MSYLSLFPSFSRSTVNIALFALLAQPAVGLPDEHPHGSGEDRRQLLTLSAGEKHFLLSEMRHFLAVTQRILAAGLRGEMQEVAAAAASAGLKAHRADLADPNSPLQGIRRKAPAAFFPLGKATHEAFDEIAEVATAIGDKDAVNRLLADNLQRCVACHANYRVGDGH
ncbi:hypothetical protein VX159_02530 [Dechloromonas sp. ZY10]|uniref:hypothetical protein n=1 Tax=Dechloromonas aquae TaxID=2664436 RepID=UPI0035290931